MEIRLNGLFFFEKHELLHDVFQGCLNGSGNIVCRHGATGDHGRDICVYYGVSRALHTGATVRDHFAQIPEVLTDCLELIR